MRAVVWVLLFLSFLAHAEDTQYLSGQEVADLYKEYAFCYDYTDWSNNCRTLEVISARTGTQIRIIRSHAVNYNYGLPKDGGELVADIIFENTSLKPDGIIINEPQTHTITDDGLCRSLSVAYRDAENFSGKLFIDHTSTLTDNYRSPPTEEIERLQKIEVDMLRKRLGDVRCSHYKMDESGTVLKEYFSIDGYMQDSSPSTVNLVPKDSGVRVRQTD